MSVEKLSEHERWRRMTNPQQMLRELWRNHRVSTRRGGRRKLRLFGCAAARVIWHALPDDRFRAVVEASERHANQMLKRAKLQATHSETQRETWDLLSGLGNTVQTFLSIFGMASPAWTRETASLELVQQIASPGFGVTRALTACTAAVRVAVAATGERDNPEIRLLTEANLCHAIRDLFRSTWDPIEIPSEWRTSCVRSVARASLQNPCEDRLPILADALEEVGCDNSELLTHCRDGGPHYRGCWVVDSLLKHNTVR